MEAIGKLDQTNSWESKENPQGYEQLKVFGEHVRPTQHRLGLVGGNEVPYANRQLQVELESDLRGITRPNTFCPTRQHLPKDFSPHVASITRIVPKQTTSVKVVNTPLTQSQMWAYPATLAPEPFVIETCKRPEKY